jgi:hypothetical protein
LLVLVSLVPRWLQRRSRVAGDLLRAGVLAVLLDAFVLGAGASAATAGAVGPAFESPVLTNNGGR